MKAKKNGMMLMPPSERRGLRELGLCRKLEGMLDLSKKDFELIPIIREEVLKVGLPNRIDFYVKILH